MSIEFVTDAGVSWPLDGSGGIQMVDTDEGVFNTPWDLTLEQRVGADGAVLLQRRRGPQRVVISLLIVDAVSALEMWRPFLVALTGGGMFRFDAGAGLRELRQVVLEAPDRSMTGQDMSGRVDEVIRVSVLALDPWWYGTAVSQEVTIAAPTAWNAAIPWDSAIPWDGGGSVGLSIVGDAPAWPYWTLHGELDTLTVAVVDAGAWTWDTTLNASSYGTVDHRPGYRSPRLGSELNGVEESAFGLWGLVSEASSLDWGLPPGDVSVIVGATGDGGSTSLSLWYEPRWLSP